MYQSRIKNKKERADRFQKKRILELPDENEGTYFGIVKDMLGNGRVNVLVEDGTMKMARIRGKMRKSRNKTIIDKNDLVMVAGRDFDDKMMDIMYKYTLEEVQQLISDQSIPEKIYKNMTESDMCRIEGTDEMIVFCDHPKTTDSDQEDDQEEEKEEQDNQELEDINIDEI